MSIRPILARDASSDLNVENRMLTVRATRSQMASGIDRRSVLARLREASAIRCEDGFKQPMQGEGSWSPLEWGGAMAGEVGELLNLIKKVHMGRPITKEAIADEMADVMIYLDLLAFVFDIDLDAAIVRKFNLVSDRIGSTEKL